MVTDEQVKLLRRLRMEGKSQLEAAARSGMCERTARRWERGELPSETKRERTWRTRPDPFSGVWEEEIVPLLESDRDGVLEAVTVLEELERRYPERYSQRQLRTLQRRMREWRAVFGPAKEVIFEQEHPPGREGAVDFTHGKDLGVTIGGVLLVHLLFAFRLSASGWTWVEVAFGETFEALVRGLQNALFRLGGVPEVIRHDNLSAATHELRRSGGRALTRRFEQVLAHYGTRSTRIRPGEAHENGIVEKGHDLVKRQLRQALVLRGSRDFVSLAAYEAFAQETIEATLNASRGEAFEQERARLQPLPSNRLPDYTVYRVKVRSTSTIRVGKRVYSVPSNLIGHEVRVHQHPDHLVVYFGERQVERMPRLRGDQEVRIDYRHVIWSLVRKPGAFLRYRYREELFPSVRFREAWDRLVSWRGERACVEYVRILHLAASRMESEVERVLGELLASGSRFDYAAVRARCEPEPIAVPQVSIPAPDLEGYDHLLGGVR